MKKISILLVVLILSATLITACSESNTDVSSGESVNESGDASLDTSANESSGSVKKDPPTYTGISVGANAQHSVISNGASYTSQPAASNDYPDSYTSELTDGVRISAASPSYSEEAASGYESSAGQTFVIDLGYESDKIFEFKVGYLATNEAGIGPVGNVTVYGSLDGKKFDRLGKGKAPTFENGKVEEIVITLENYIKARYIRFYITGTSHWLFLDELSVIADVENTSSGVDFVNAVNDAYNALGTVARPAGVKEIDYDLTKTSISKGAKYTVDAGVINKFKDTGKMLTDGKVSGYFEGETWVGFASDKDSTVVIDLGKTVDDISSVEASFYTNTAVKLYLPVAIKVAALDESKNKTELGILYANTMITSGNYCFVLPFNKTVSARYIEITLIATDSTMFLAEEFSVYAYREYDEDSFYPPLKLETNSGDWGSEGNDKYVNLVADTVQQIVSATDISKDVGANNTPVTSKVMTDGLYSPSTDIHNGRFFKFNGGGDRTIVFDLKHVSSVDKILASFTHQSDWGVHAPQTIQVSVTEDGKEWYEAGVMEKKGNNAAYLVKYELKLSKKVKARYVSLKFPVQTWAGIDEVEICGTTSTANAKSPASAGLKKATNFTNKRIEPSNKILNGAKDTCLLYHNTRTGYKVEDLIPYLAYVDENGKMQDTMFDSFLFLMMSQFPSGGYPYAKGVKTDWEWVLNDLFGDGKNIKALDEAVSIVKQELGLPENYKYKVILSLYYPSPEITNFGDVDGDGVSENLSKFEDTMKAIEWYLNLTEDTFNAQNFENIELVGYYWFHEAINSEDDMSLRVLNSTSDLVHKKGKDFCWIPYFASNGYNAWSEYGFDVAVMQPNYVFKLETPYSNVTNCAKLTAMYGMGVEMEICTDSLSNIQFFKKYMQYVAGGAEYGYMNDCIVMYYQEMFAFRDACKSGTLMGRMIYDATYHFIKGDLEYKPEAISGAVFEASKNTPLKGEFKFDTEKLREFKITGMPEHGAVTINNDGSFTFYPEKDFVGEVKFSFAYSEYLGWSDACEVTINVK